MQIHFTDNTQRQRIMFIQSAKLHFFFRKVIGQVHHDFNSLIP